MTQSSTFKMDGGVGGVSRDTTGYN